MIKCDKGDIILKGAGTELLGDLSALVHAMYEALTEKAGGDPDEVKSDIVQAVELGFKSRPELEDEARKALAGLFDLLGKAVDKLSDKLNSDKKEGN